jgi:hypothetical protein
MRRFGLLPTLQTSLSTPFLTEHVVVLAGVDLAAGHRWQGGGTKESFSKHSTST